MNKRAGLFQAVTCIALLCGFSMTSATVSGAQGPGSSSISSVPRSDRQAALRSAVSTHLSTPAAIVDAPFRVGSGDLLNISVWQERELSPTVTVRPDGKISMPLIGEIAVTGLTPVDVENLLRERLAAIVINPKVTVTVVEIHSRMVYITGEVSRPGAYPLNSPLNVLQLIAQAGGLTEFASRKKIRVVQANSTDSSITFDYNRILRSGDPSRNLPLSPGDTVVVP